jgi:D-glycero-D-manno-heptose 1,7-bisphosphate phosphatase
MNRAIFLDRDGVLNQAIVKNGKPHPPRSIEELEIYGDAAEACTRLKEAGFLLIVVTNQPDVARGAQTREVVETINEKLALTLGINEFCVCYHDDNDNCACRKPKPGLLLAAAQDLSINLKVSFMIGDRWRDIDAGIAAGCRTVFIDRRYDERKPASPSFTARSLREAADWILSQGFEGGVRDFV